MRGSHSSHWGAFEALISDEGRLIGVHPFSGDPDPSPMLGNFVGAVESRARVARPLVRKGWLDGGPRADPHRGIDKHIEISWEHAYQLVANELRRVYREHGAEAVFAGSYGWASAGRFHHAQSQIHRFMNHLGGYTRSVNTYSQGAAAVIFPHVIGLTVEDIGRSSTSWGVIAKHTELFVAFGGVPRKNAEVCVGGTGEHTVRDSLAFAAASGTRFLSISPLADDIAAELDAEWLPIEPGTDTALMLALAYVLHDENLADRGFLARYCTGYERFLPYLLGGRDGIPKTPDWAAGMTGIGAGTIVALARRMAASRTMIVTAYSLQRSWYGEQPMWMSVVLAAMLGQIGLPGGGLGHGYGMNSVTGSTPITGMPTLSQGENPIDSFIPVARIADMLLEPGGEFSYDGKRLTYPDIRLVYWCGGNPFHHHPDLLRLRAAFSRPESVIVHEPFWTASARHADIVLPATTTFERNDIGGSAHARHVFAMKKVLATQGEAKNDYSIFSDLACRLGFGSRFTEGRNEMQWLRWLYDKWRIGIPPECGSPPDFDAFWDRGFFELVRPAREQVLLEEFRANPLRAPLATPSGRIEIFSSTIAGFEYEDCPGHPIWREPREWRQAPLAKRYPLVLIANNPRTRLHSQMDCGEYSRASKVAGREPVRLNPQDAAARRIRDGEVVRLYNERASCLAGAVLSDAVKPGVVQLSTGAWLDLREAHGIGPMCVHGNPNVLTADHGTSRLAQGPIGQICLVEVERFVGLAPEVRAWDGAFTSTADALRGTDAAAFGSSP